MNTLICSSVGATSSVTVTASGIKIITNDKRNRFILITNLSDESVYITPRTVAEDDECPAKPKEGIALVGKGDKIQLTNSCMFFCDFWAITESGKTADIAVLVGRA